MKNKTSFLGHSKIEFYFKQSVRDFVVDEIPLYDFTKDGEHLILKIRKKNLATWDLINLLAKHLDIHKKEIGYAGLKDKNALTIQYISILKKHFPEQAIAPLGLLMGAIPPTIVAIIAFRFI